MTWPTAPLGEHLKPVSTADPARVFRDKEFIYVDLGSVDRTLKQIVSPALIAGIDAPSRARQVLATGDILVSTVRPILNAVARVDADLDGAIASTGFAVLRPSPQLDHTYLFHWVRSSSFIGRMVRQATGASYPAVSDRIVREARIPLPPLEEQRRVARLLDAADVLRKKRARAIATLETLVDALFADMFVTNSDRDWPTLAVIDLVDHACGGIRTGPFGSQLLHGEFVDDGVAVLGIDNAVTNEFRWAESRYITEAKYATLKRYIVRPGDLLITIMGTCGRVAVVPDDISRAINTKHLCCITLDQDRCLPSFLHAYFLRHPIARSYLASRAKGAIMSGLNMGIIKGLPVCLPPVSVQREFNRRLQRIASAQRTGTQHRAYLDGLIASLQHRAFAGAL